MKKLSILLLADAAFGNHAGSFNAMSQWAKALAKKGHNVVITTAKFPGSKHNEIYDKIKIYKLPSVPLISSKKQIYMSLPSIVNLMRIIKKEKIDIVHVTLPTPLAIIAVTAAKMLGKSAVAHSHTQPENLFLNLPKKLQSKHIDKLFYKYLLWLYKKADVTICPSKFSKDILKKHHPKLKTKVISNGVDTSKFKKTDTTDFFKKYKALKDKKNILFVGRLHPEKSVDTLIKAMPYILKGVKNAHISIIGGGHLKESLDSLNKKMKLQKHISILGKVSDKDLLMAYNACDVFVLPSIAELEGLVVLEAMACGKPIIIANSKESASKHFVNKNGLLFKLKDPKDLAEKAIKLLNNDKLRKKMGEQSYKNVKEFDVKNSVEKLEKLYFSLYKKNKD